MKKQLPGWAVLLIITLIAGIALGATYALTKDPIADQARIQAENARKSALPGADSFEEIQAGEGIDWAYEARKDGQVVGYVAQKTVKGFGGEVEVIAGIDTQDPGALSLTGISVGGSSFSETAGLGARSRDKAFTDQFIGKPLPVKFVKAGEEKGDNTVDALTSATITTTAVVNGVNDISKYVKADILGIAGVEMPARPADGVYSATAQGFRGPVYVEAAFNGSEISYISVGDGSFAEDIGVGAKDADFMIQFIGKSAPVDMADVDALAGATITTNAVVTALNDAYAQASGGAPAPVGGKSYTAEALYGSGALQVTITEENGVLTSLSVKEKAPGAAAFAASEGEARLQSLVGEALPLSVARDDLYAFCAAVAVNKAYAQAQPQQAEAPAQPAGETYTAEALYGSGALQVTITEENGVLTSLSVREKATGAAAYAASEGESKLQSFVGKALPLSVAQDDPYAFCAAVAINKAYALANPQADADAQTSATPDGTTSATASTDATEAPAATETPAATEAPAATDAPAATEAPAVTDTPVTAEVKARPAAANRSDGETLMFFTAYQASVTVTDGRIADVSLSARPVGADGYAPLDSEEEIRAQLIGQSLPIEAGSLQGVPGYTAAAIALAVNQAAENGGEAAAVPDEDSVTYTGESLIFTTGIRADATFIYNWLFSLRLSEKQIGETEYAPMDREADYQNLLCGARMPITAADAALPGVPDYIAEAVALAVNDAYGRTPAARSAFSPNRFQLMEYSNYLNEIDKVGPSAALSAFREKLAALEAVTDSLTDENEKLSKLSGGRGSCVVFFTKVRASCMFSGDRLALYELYLQPLSGDQREETSLDAGELYDRLYQATLPLNAADYTDSSLPEYLTQAIVIAVNQAYEQSLRQ